MHILVITPFFPPDSHVSSNRWERISREFVKQGHKVTIVTIERPAKGAFAIPQLGNQAPKGLDVIRIPFSITIYIRYYAQLLVGIPIYTVPRRLFQLKGKMRRFLLNLRTDLTLPWTYPEFHHCWAYSAFQKLIKENTLETVDIVIGSHPFSSMLELARLLHWHLKVPWVADFRDPWCRDTQGLGLLRTILLKKTEHDMLQSAEAVVTINRQLAAMLETNKGVDIIPNCFAGHEQDDFLPNKISSGSLRIVYAGQVLPFSNAGFCMQSLRCLEIANSCFLSIEYYGSQFHRLSQYGTCLASRGIEMRDNGFVPQDRIQTECRNCDLLLLFGWNGPGKECVVTGKIFDYLQSGRPIIAITEQETALSELINQTGAGVVLHSEESITRFFQNLILRGRSLVSEIEKKRNQGAVEAYSAKNASKSYLAVLERCLASSS